ncbi:RNA polymerase sigma factor [Paenibacillus marinisediminis]
MNVKHNSVYISSRKTDQSLVIEFQQGNEDAFHELVERHRHFVLTCICRSVTDKYLAEDIAQDVWLKVYRSLHTYRGEAKFTTWLYRLTRNQLIDSIRKWKPNLQVDLSNRDVTDFMPETSVSHWCDLPEECAIQHEQCQQVQDTLNQLPLKYRSIMVLYHMRERSYAEIAEQMAMPVRTVETRLYRAKSLFKRAWMQTADLS